MKIVKRLLTIFIVLFVLTPSSFSQDQIVYLDLDYVVVNTKAGKSILNELENSKNIALSKFEKKGKELKKIEEEINKQKNIISEDELRKKLIEFRLAACGHGAVGHTVSWDMAIQAKQV